jgi:hypothetical protein
MPANCWRSFVLTDRMKTLLIDETGGELHFTTEFLGFAAYCGNPRSDQVKALHR